MLLIATREPKKGELLSTALITCIPFDSNDSAASDLAAGVLSGIAWLISHGGAVEYGTI